MTPKSESFISVPKCIKICEYDLSNVPGCIGLDWTKQRLTSPPTQYRLSGRQFYRSKDPTNSIKVLKEMLASHSMEEAPIPSGTSHRVTSEPLKREKPYHRGSSPARQSPTQHATFQDIVNMFRDTCNAYTNKKH